MTDIMKVVDEFGPLPYGRYPADGDYNGQRFRKEFLAPRLLNSIRNNDVLFVDLDGYNRYGRSFLDEAFGGLIREENFTLEQIKTHLKYRHSLVKSIEMLIEERINAASNSPDI